MLCHRCQFATQQAADFEEGDAEFRIGPHHPTLSSLKQSVEDKCYVCSLFGRRLNLEEANGVPPADLMVVSELASSEALPNGTEYVLFLNEHSPESYDLRISPRNLMGADDGLQSFDAITPAEITSKSQWFSFYCETGLNTVSDPMKLRQNTWSANTISLAKRWIESCLKYHQCTSKKSTPWHPTRLLNFDLQQLPTEQSCVRLIETKKVGFAGRYTTLSHCWGKGVHLTLTKQTYSSLLQGYPLSKLPRLFQDAITVSRDLGVAHIWIDSLCIFQDPDDKSDWQREASLMQEVYSHSFCNISAAHCANSSESMFAMRDPEMLLPEVVEMQVSESIESDLIYAEQRRHRFDEPKQDHTGADPEGPQTPHDVSSDTFEPSPRSFKYLLADFLWSDVTEAVLNTRAWVVQERLLSPRILHFGQRQVHWECCVHCASEVYPDGFPDIATDGSFQYKSSIPAMSTGDTPRAGTSRIASDLHWRTIMETYTSCNLSFGSDKLVAISGIAARFKSTVMHGDEYLAGIWRKGMKDQLLWWANNPTTRPNGYRAPSWSWASLDGPISSVLDTDGDSLLIRVDAVHVAYSTPNLTGAVTDGWLRLWGILKRVRLVRNSHAGWDIALDDVVALEDRNKPIMLRTMVLFDTVNVDEENGKGECHLFCMIASDPTRLSAKVLLFQSLDEQAGIFRRVGLAFVGDGKLRSRLKEKSRTDERLPCVQYKDGEHLICVV